jgi:hypothetical protein
MLEGTRLFKFFLCANSKGIKEKCFLDFTERPMEIYEWLLLCSFESVEYRESSLIANICNEGCLMVAERLLVHLSLPLGSLPS